MALFNGAGRLMALALLVAVTSSRSLGSRAGHLARDVPTLVGCFSSSQPLSNQGYYQYQSSGHCSGICTSLNQGVVGLSNGTNCWCGSKLPAADTKVLDSKCNTPCQGYGVEDCGGGKYYFTIWLTGLEANVPNYSPNGDTTSSATSSTTAQSSSVSSTSSSMATNTEASSTSGPTSSTPASASPSDSQTKGDKKIGIIVGVVLGIVAFLIMGLLFWCLRRRRKSTGSYFRGRSPAPLLLANASRPDSAASSVPEATIYVSAGSRKWEGRISRTPATSHHSAPEMAESSRSVERGEGSTSGDTPFYTPQEQRSIANSNHGDSDTREPCHPAALEHDNPMQIHTSTSAYDAAYQPTPFSPAEMKPQGSNTLQQYEAQRQSPFASPHDDEGVDAISRLAPSKNTERVQSFPGVHYPSWSEVSDFDFTGDGGGQFKRKDGEGWHPWRERRDGRYELA